MSVHCVDKAIVMETSSFNGKREIAAIVAERLWSFFPPPHRLWDKHDSRILHKVKGDEVPLFLDELTNLVHNV